jgi:transketolase
MSIEPIPDKFRAFGWEVREINGHDIKGILQALDEARGCKTRPFAIIARTIKGKGCSFMENQVEWHGQAPSREQVEEALRELECIG